jgi:tetratricopeptide (TPR) repeat protein
VGARYGDSRAGTSRWFIAIEDTRKRQHKYNNDNIISTQMQAEGLSKRGDLEGAESKYIEALEECIKGLNQTFDRLEKQRMEVQITNMMKVAEVLKQKIRASQFVPAKRCTGPKKGYYFRLGPQGLGWYVDTVQRAANQVKQYDISRQKNESHNYKTARKLASKAVEYDKERDFKTAYDCYKKAVDYYHCAAVDTTDPSRKIQIEKELEPYKKRCEHLGGFLKKATYWSYTGDGTNRSDKANSRYDDAVQHAKDAVKADTEGRYDDAVASYTSACEDFLVALQFKLVPNPARESVKSRIRSYMSRAEALKKIVEENPERFAKRDDEVSTKPRTIVRFDEPKKDPKPAPLPPGDGNSNGDADGDGEVTLEDLEARFKTLYK